MEVYGRIIAGSCKGRSILAPKGMDTRPTLDRVKESLFGIIQFQLYGKTVLDSIKNFNIDKTHIRTENGNTASNRTYLTSDGDRYYKDD